MLNANTKVVIESFNPTFKLPRDPTVNKEDSPYIPVKHNFSTTIDCPVSKATVQERIKYANSTVKKNIDGSEKSEHKNRTNGCIDLAFSKKSGLGTTSTPKDGAKLLSLLLLLLLCKSYGEW